MYVIFEGIDTSGKSTQIHELCKLDKNIIATKEPGKTKLGITLRDIILHSENLSKEAEFFLFLADRAEHFNKIIKPNLDKLIISDRGFISGMAYAFSNDMDMELDFLLQVNKYALLNTMPDKVVLFEMSEDLLKQRLNTKSHDSIEKRGIKYLLHVQKNMKEIVKYLKLDCLYVDANKSIEEITNQIKGFLK